MGNHIYLAAQVGEVPLWRIIQHLGFRYTQWCDRRHGRVGHLLQGRYKALLVDAESCLLVYPPKSGTCRAVKKPERYRWSGHRAYLGEERLSWLETR